MALPADFAETANERYKQAKRFWANWQGDAREWFAFVAGDQWMQEDLDILNEQKRPSITFNYSEKMIDAVVGAEVQSRQEVRYLPREMSDVQLAELWTNANKWCRDESNAEDEESDAFRDALICGMGWTHTRMSYESDLDGLVEENRIDPLEMLPDPSAVKPGLTDRRYTFRDIWIEESTVKRNWPQAIGFAEVEQDASGVDVVRQGQHYNDLDTESGIKEDQHKGKVQLRHYECVELTPVYRVAMPDGSRELNAAEFAKIKDELDSAGTKYIKQHKRVYYYAYFAGETFLEGDVSPTQRGFTYNCITGKRDRNKGSWYGLTKVMVDPQRWANKWLSQILHIINSNAKGGLLAEVGAFVDPERAQDEWAQADKITLLKEGGITKIKEKAMAQYPNGLDRLMEFALSSLPQVTGINLEALGLAGREQANVLEQSRKQAAYGLLSPVFDALRRFRKSQGKVALDFIVNYMSDGRMIRIGGPESEQFVRLNKPPKDAIEMDIIVDQAPTAPDVKSKTWEMLSQLLPALMKAGIPVPPDVLDYTPFPTQLSIKWKQYIAQQQQNTSPEAVQKMQEQMQELASENQQLQTQLADKSQEMQLEQQKVQQELEIQRNKAMNDIMIKREELNLKREIERERLQADTSANYQQMVQEGTSKLAQDHQQAILNAIETLHKLDMEEQTLQLKKDAQASKPKPKE
jgi:hypothetical protein